MSGKIGDAKLFARRYLQGVSEGNLAVLDEFVNGEEFKSHVTELAMRWRTAFSDLHIEVEEVIVEANRVVTEETMTGTHDGVY